MYLYVYRIVAGEGRTQLTIHNADVPDAGWYQCSALSVAGSATSRAKVGVLPRNDEPKTKESRLIIPKKTTKM